MPTISVVVPTFRRPDWLAEALATLAAQSQTSSEGAFDYDVWVVDNNSGDRTPEVVAAAAAAASVPIHYVCQTQPGDAPTRNAGIDESGQQPQASEFVAFFDDDQFAPNDWLANLFAAARQTQADIVGGPVKLQLSKAESQRLGRICREMLREIDFSPVRVAYRGKQLPGTGNALVRRSLLEQLGRFDESFTAGGSDSDFFLRARERGATLLYDPDSPIVHRVPEDRTTRAYFRWNALASGAEHCAKFDLEHHGRLGLLTRCLARLGQATAITLPRYTLARLSGNEGEVMGRRTLLWRCEGYARRTARELLGLKQPAFFASLDMRAGRTVAEADAKAASPRVPEPPAAVSNSSATAEPVLS